MFTASIPIYLPPGALGNSIPGAKKLTDAVAEKARLVASRGTLAVFEAVEAGRPRRIAQRALAKLADEERVIPMGNGQARRYVPAG